MAEKDFRAMGPQELMRFLNSTPLENHSIETRSGRNPREGQDEENSSTRKEKVSGLSMIKAQKKGTMQIAHLPLAMVGTYDNLLRSLTTLFPPPEGTGRDITMSTFEGDLISSPEEYIAVLKPELHIIFNYPPTVEEVSMSFGALWATHAPRTVYTPNPSDSTPMESRIINTYPNSASQTLTPLVNLKKYELQPPEIHFHVPAPTPISITLFNASFPTAYFYSPKDPEDVPVAAPSAPKAFRYTPEKSRESVPTLDFTSTSENAHAPLPPWSPFSLYKNPGNSSGSGSTDAPSQHVWEGRPDGECKLFSGGTFATTSFDVFAQTERQRVICSLSWEVEVSPGGAIKDLVSEEDMQTLSWHSTDDQLAPPLVTMRRGKTSEKKVYANYAEPFGGGNTTSRWGEREEDGREIGRAGWWMVAPRRLPLSFSGKQEGERTFIVGSVEEGVELLQAFMTRCGVGEDIIKSYTTYWAPKLTFNLPPPYTNHAPTVGLYMSLIHPKSLLIKFLYPRELRTLLPLSITPEPHRTVRIFPIFRAVDAGEVGAEDIAPSADFETEVEKVLGGMGSCGGGWNCGHRGFKVAEVGGIRVFGPPDSTGEGEDEEGTVIGVNPPGADGDGGWGDVADLDALVVGDEGMRGIRREGYSSGEDTV